jgi:hypothetical protein
VYSEPNILRFGVSAVTNRETADLPNRIPSLPLCDHQHLIAPWSIKQDEYRMNVLDD